jgi:uncharacterized repeat protein (TIGR03803 family)
MNLKRGGRRLAGLALILVIASGAWAASEKVLYAFHGTDGCGPTSVIVGADGALYGTTEAAGTTTCSADGPSGAVFQLTRGSDGTWTETVLHLFTGSDGSFPNGALVADKAGNLYGTTVYGGSTGCSNRGCGVAFELERGSDGTWAYKILHLFFQKQGDGLQPYAGMTFDSKGNLYGTTSGGGNFNVCTGGCGVVFELSPDGKGNWIERVLYSFLGKDGAEPLAPLVFGPSGDLYGTTEYGGSDASGVVFKLTPGEGGQWSEEVLHSFSAATKDGDQPTYGLTFDHAGNIYGTTQFGGSKNQEGWGTAFKLTPEKDRKWSETILHRFNRAKFGGGFVYSGLVLDGQANLYGSALEGGKYSCPGSGGIGCGVVFRLRARANGKWAETVLHSFGKGNDGSGPYGNLVFDSSGHLCGVAPSGGGTGGPCGQYGCGVVFEVKP